MKHLTISASLLLLAQTAVADSFCEYDKGYLGTTAIGIISPHELSSHAHSEGAKQCFVTVQPDADRYARYTAFDVSCFDIEPLPSRYIYTPQNVPADHDPSRNEYFAYMVFKETPKFLELRLRDGTPIFVKKPALYEPRFTGEHMIGMEGLTTSEKLYSAPDITAETHAPNYTGDIQQSFVSRMVEHPDFDPKQMDVYMTDIEKRNTFRLWLVDFSYTVTAIVTGPDGRQWYKTEEQIKLDTQGAPYPNLRNPDPDADYEGTIQSDVLRTVYLPFRDPEGRIESVFLPGPYCD